MIEMPIGKGLTIGKELKGLIGKGQIEKSLIDSGPLTESLIVALVIEIETTLISGTGGMKEKGSEERLKMTGHLTEKLIKMTMTGKRMKKSQILEIIQLVILEIEKEALACIGNKETEKPQITIEKG